MKKCEKAEPQAQKIEHIKGYLSYPRTDSVWAERLREVRKGNWICRQRV